MTNSVFLTNKNARSCQLYYTKMQHFMLITVRLQRIYALVRQFQPRPALPPPPPRLLRDIFPPYSPGGGVLANFALPGGREFANHEVNTEIFGTHVVSNPNITTQRILLGKQADWLICQGGERIIEDC